MPSKKKFILQEKYWSKDRVVLSLGSNLGNKKEFLFMAVQELKKKVKACRVSSVYETSPVDNVYGRQQPRYYNLSLSGVTKLSPQEFIKFTQKIEKKITEKAINQSFPVCEKRNKGPRYLDIDIVFWGQRIVNTLELCIPHPAYQERLFVLQPLMEIEPEWRDPVDGKKITELIKIGKFSGQEVIPIGFLPFTR